MKPDSDIAICGIGLRLPGNIRSGEDFWNVLVNGVDTRVPVPTNRYNANAFDQSLGSKSGTSIKFGHFLSDDIFKFDPTFFSYTKDETEKMDPQQRLLLEVVRECLDDAGEVNYRGQQVGCYVGTFGEDWVARSVKDTQAVDHVNVLGYFDLMVANRVSYEYDLRGPSLVIQTGCSASLVALHEACRAIRGGDATSAIVAGTSIITSPIFTAAMSNKGVLSNDGSCKTFDAAADGYGRGEAINAIYIKTLADAIRDGNPVRAIIRGTGSNSDGKSSSLLSPSSVTQIALMKQVYREANLDPRETAFVECHGTGTAVGDPIETSAVSAVFGHEGILIGSVKPNIGHSEGAAGISSLIKAVLALEHDTIPPNIKLTKPNPGINFDKLKLKVPLSPTPFPSNRCKRVSINSFGIGGSNAHAILDLYVPSNKPKQNGSAAGNHLAKNGDTSSSEKTSLFLFSGNTESSLKEQIKLYKHRQSTNSKNISDIAYTLGLHREHLRFRSYTLVKGSDFGESAPIFKAPHTSVDALLVFNGQGGQWPMMGMDLIQNDKTFRRDILEMDAGLQSLSYPPTWSLMDELLKPADESRVSEAEISQPLCTAVQIALFNRFKSLGLTPTAVVGHSSGEIAAAYASGALSMRSAIAVAYYRGYVLKKHSHKGTMAAIGMGSREIQKYLKGDVVVACENSHNNTTISGDTADVLKVLELVKKDMPELLARQLKVEKAYHSHHMVDAGLEYEELMTLDKIGHSDETAPSTVGFFSSVDGKLHKYPFTPNYWVKNLVSRVRFSTAVSNMLVSHAGIVLEIGPHGTLSSAMRDALKTKSQPFNYTSAMSRGLDCMASFLSSVGYLHQHGVQLNLKSLLGPGKAVSGLPVYPWDHERSFHNESRMARAWTSRSYPDHCLLGSRVPEGGDLNALWRNVLHVSDQPWISEHMIGGSIIFPFAGYIAMAGEAIRQLKNAESGASYRIRHAVVHSALTVSTLQPVEMTTSLRPYRLSDGQDSSLHDFSIMSYDGSVWTKHCEGQICLSDGGAAQLDQSIRMDLPRIVEPTRIYGDLAIVGYQWGPEFRGLKEITAATTKKIAAAQVPNIEPDSPFTLHPITIDMSLQLMIIARAKGLGRHVNGLSLPTAIEEIFIGPTKNPIIEGRAVWDDEGSPCVEGIVDGTVVLRASGINLRSVHSDEASNSSRSHFPARLHWFPDFEMIDKASLIIPPTGNRDGWVMLEEIGLLCLLETYDKVKSLSPGHPHFGQFRDWLQYELKAAADGVYKRVEDPASLMKLSRAERVKAMYELRDKLMYIPGNRSPINVATAMLRLFEHFEQLFTGEVDGLSLLRDDNLLTKMYDDSIFDCSNFAKVFSHANPRLRILEVGAGTGATALHILKALKGQIGRPLYSSYTFTDISAGFFPAAKERLADFSNVDFKVFDISKSPTDQDFELDSYDLIIATNVIHAAPVLQESLLNLQPLLRKDGLVLITEPYDFARSTKYVFGVFEGWWLGVADGRVYEPYVSVERWDKELRGAGFSGVDTAVRDDVDPYGQAAVMISRKVATSNKGSKARQVSILTRDSKDQDALAVQSARDSLKGDDWDVNFCQINGEISENQTIVSFLDLDHGFFEALSESQLTLMQQFVKSLGQQKLLWILPPIQVGCEDPRSAQTLGALRGIRTELGIDLFTLEISEAEEGYGNLIAKVLNKIEAIHGDDTLDSEREFIVSNGHICIPRYHPFSPDEEALSSGLSGEDIPALRSSKLTVGKIGMLDSVAWKADAVPAVIPQGYVEIQGHAAGLNFRDVAYATGIVPSISEDTPLGIELSGTITRVSETEENLAIGDRVVALLDHGVSSLLTVPANVVVKIPDSMTFEQAATIPVCYATALHALVDIGSLRKSMSVLIHSACGGLGLAAIQIARMIGAEVFATVGTEEKIQHLTSKFAIPEDHIFSSRDASFVEQIMKKTAGRGADLVLNSLAGDLLHASWKCVAKYGMLLEVGKRDLVGHGQLNMHSFLDNRSYCGIDLSSMLRDRPLVVRSLVERSIDYIRLGLLKPLEPITIFDSANGIKALVSLKAGRHIGKFVLEMSSPASQTVFKSTSAKKRMAFDPDSAFLMVGGLSGLGMSFAVWLAESGAKTLIFLSRNAGVGAASEQLRIELESLDCEAVFVKGSVTNIEHVKNAIQASPVPIKGVLHLAMIRRDCSFVDMTIEDWYTVQDPKVQGALNLHRAFDGHALDFFWLASSMITAMDQVGQSNYKAANMYLEALCQHRNSLGLPASVLCIGAIEDVGTLTYDAAAMRSMRLQEQHFIRQKELLQHLETTLLSSDPSMSARFKTEHWSPSTRAVWEPLCHPNHVFLGLASEKHLDDPTNQTSWRRDKRMGYYHNVRDKNIDGNEAEVSSLQILVQEINAGDSDVFSNPEISERIAEEVGKKTNDLLLRPDDEVDIELGLGQVGVDSLTSIELRRWFKQIFGIEVNVLELVKSKSIKQVGEIVAARLKEKQDGI